MGEEKKTSTLRDKFLSIAPSVIEKVERCKKEAKDKRTIEICSKIVRRLKELQKKEILFKGQKGKEEIDSMIRALDFILSHLFVVDSAKVCSDKNDDGRTLSKNMGDCLYQNSIIENYLSSILTGAYSCVIERYAKFHKSILDYLDNEAFRDPDFGDFYMP